MTRIIGLLNFYDEPIPDLVACLEGLASAGTDHVVAVDGAYALYPDGKPASDPNQHAALVLSARQLGLGLTLHNPNAVWVGNEVQKRSFLFGLGWAVAEPGDWFWVIDADEVVMRAPDDLKDRLAATEHDAVEVEALDTVALRANQPDWPPRFAVRQLFRAQPITTETNHNAYVTGDGRLLRGFDRDDLPIESALDLTRDVLVEHRPDRREFARLLAKQMYYAARDEAAVERGTCTCGEPAIELVATRWRMTRIGPVAQWAESCESCAKKREKVGRMQLLQLGVDPDSVTIENRNGHVPMGMTAS